MSYILIIIYSCIITCLILVGFIFRDLYYPLSKKPKISKPRKNSKLKFKKYILYYYAKAKQPVHFWQKNKRIAWASIIILSAGILIGIYARFVEPYTLYTHQENLRICGISQPIKVVFVSDIQVGDDKQTAWVQKIVDKIIKINPDLVILGGDLVDNERGFYDESKFLEPLSQLADKFATYYIMGNHEYGIGSKTIYHAAWRTADVSQWVTDRMQKLGIPLLRNNLKCLVIKNQNICLFGADDIWKRPINFAELKQWNQTDPLLFLVHNPDGVLYWPQNYKRPSLVLSGHTHGGQIWLPFIGPLGNAQLDLSKQFYRGLNYYNYIPVYTSVGAGESGGPVRFLAAPEISVITLTM